MCLPQPTHRPRTQGLHQESRTMHRGFAGIAFEPLEEKTDRELTLGPVGLVLLGILFCGICALCFVWGYSVGHRAPVEVKAAQSAPAGPPAAQIFASQPKPAASATTPQPAASMQSATPADPAVVVASGSIAAPAASGAAPVPAGGAVVQTALRVQPAQPVKAALQAQTASGLPNTTYGAVQPALGAGQWMVQIAAVSHTEDADVLVSALHKRGYAVSAHRDPGDNLIHVQVGPLASHADAASMRQRLLNDGYNALIQP